MAPITINPPPSTSPTYHIFFIPGNPGIKAYYRLFLSILSRILASDADPANGNPSPPVSIHASSYTNFEHKVSSTPFTLREQIIHAGLRLRQYCTLMQDVQRSNGDVGGAKMPRKVILVGHSLGAYMAMELVSQWRRRESGFEDVVDVAGVIGLFPALTYLAKSPSGVKLGWLAMIPFFPHLASALAGCLTIPLSRERLCQLVKMVTGQDAEAAETTTDFLRSPMGIVQALSLAREELKEITDDRWDEELWNAVKPESGVRRPQLAFYFGENDHWVANHLRDQLIAQRAFRPDEPDCGKPVMLIDTQRTPHGFCTDG
ncbi:hypothetical protein MMC25_000493 [Agyrium rufum]|nr:hypothetical protein [Agyrium rufum]